MATNSRVCLRFPDQGRAVQWETHRDVLTQEIVEGRWVDPRSEILYHNRWVLFAQCPESPWLGELLLRAVECTRRYDAAGIEQQAAKILAFGGNDLEKEAVRVACFLKGHVLMCQGDDSGAVPLLEAALKRPSSVSVAALNNLGVAWARLRDPAAALDHLEKALAADPGMITAHLSLHNLASTLTAERAPSLPGQPGWSQIAAQSASRLRAFTEAQILEFLDPDRVFPTYHVLHLFAPGPHFPWLSSQLPPAQSGALAARGLLEKANKALAESRHERAGLLAEAALQICPTLAGDAKRILVAARMHSEEVRWVGRARALADRLDSYLRSLEDLTIDNLDTPRELLALLRPFYGDTKPLEDLYRERIEQVLVGQLRPAADPKTRAQLLATARHYSVEPDARAYHEAAGLTRARASLAAFRKAIEKSDLEAAQSTLGRAEALVEGHLDRERAALESLGQAKARERCQPSLDGCHKMAEVSAQIRAGEFEAARCKLKEALATEAVPEVAARLNRELAAARNVSEARRLVADDDWKAAIVKLREAIRHEPRNRHALLLLFTLEILTAGAAGHTLDDAAATGTAAIEAFLAGNHEDCRRLSARTANSVKSSYVMRLMQALATLPSHSDSASE